MFSASKEIKRKIMEQRRPSPKFIRDPVHDIIKIEDEIILKILDTEPMQRLRFIKQLPLASYVYPGADHSRFVHSLGVYHLSIKMLNQLDINNIGKYDRLVIKLAALLHDIGHGPFSHLFENFLANVNYRSQEERKHENWTQKIIRKHPQIQEELKYISPNLTNDIVGIISKTRKDFFLSDIVSSQLDADRMDYMIRDSFMTGVQYGNFDMNWLFRNLLFEKVQQKDDDENIVPELKKIVIEGRRGLSVLEDYLLGNWYLFKHVYFHKTILSAESMVVNILKRAVDCINENIDIKIKSDALEKISNNEELELAEYLSLNDNVVLNWIHFWAKSDVDQILCTLSRDLLDRKLYSAIDISEFKGFHYSTVVKKVKELVVQKGFNLKYNFMESDTKRAAYKNLFDTGGLEEIFYKDRNSEIMPYTKLLTEDQQKISGAIIKLKSDNQLIIVPSDIKDDIERIISEVKNE